MHYIRPVRPAVVVIWLLLGGGCVGPQATGKNGALLPSRCPYEPDIPLPAGFKLADQSSEDWSSGSIRYLRHRYRGQAGTYAVRTFYREQMPLVRWTAISDSAVHGRVTMRFERADESCMITIEEEPAGLSSRVVVEVKIAPLTRRPAAQIKRS